MQLGPLLRLTYSTSTATQADPEGVECARGRARKILAKAGVLWGEFLHFVHYLDNRLSGTASSDKEAERNHAASKIQSLFRRSSSQASVINQVQ